MGQFARATALLALVVVTGLLFAGTAGATGSHTNHVSKVADACATPSLQDVADSDFFWYWPCASFLHVETNPAGASLGYVRSTPYAIDCPHACTRPFAAGTSVVLTAYPSNGASFTSWSGACAGQGNPCTVTVNGDTQVTANFGGTVIPKVTHSPMVTLTIFFGLVSSMLPVDTYTFTNPPGGAGGLCDASGGTCSYSYSPGTIVSVTVSDDDNDEDRFRVNGVFGFGTWDSGTSSTTYTFDINSSTVI
ncbi:MAG TPA: hypothetical protein VFW85_11755, partial [Gaiellaceae bacterium]|nr:hypothetical protein [Gaiellaceae bacterium]